MRSAVFVLMFAMSSLAMAQEPAPEVVAPPAQAPAAPAATPARRGPAAPVKVKRPRLPAGALWGQLGLNFAHVEDSEYNCFGGQYGAGVRVSALYVRWTRTAMSYEANDHTGTCDGLLWGDSDVRESAWTGGLMLGRTGLFLGLGRTDVNVERSFENTVDYGRDHGRRYEIGYTSRMQSPHGFGFEVLLFRGINDVRDYGGISFGVSLGT